MMISAAEAAAAALSPPLSRGIVLSPSLLELQVTDGESIEGTPPLSVAVQRLTRLRKHLRTVVDPKKDALNQARMLDLDVVDDETFRLMFLRAAKFDPTASANRLMEHVKQKQELFVGGSATSTEIGGSSSASPASLTKQLQLSDLNTEDLAALQSGGIEVFLPDETTSQSFLVFNYGKIVKYLSTKGKPSFVRTICDFVICCFRTLLLVDLTITVSYSLYSYARCFSYYIQLSNNLKYRSKVS